MDTGRGKRYIKLTACLLNMAGKRRMSVLIKAYIGSPEIKHGRKSVSNIRALDILDNLAIVINLTVDDKQTVFGQQIRETLERTANIVNILKEIEMVFFYIKYD